MGDAHAASRRLRRRYLKELAQLTFEDVAAINGYRKEPTNAFWQRGLRIMKMTEGVAVMNESLGVSTEAAKRYADEMAAEIVYRACLRFPVRRKRPTSPVEELRLRKRLRFLNRQLNRKRAVSGGQPIQLGVR